MKKLINDKNNLVDEMLQGTVRTYPYLKKISGINSVIYTQNKRKVTLISGGGSGHEPLDIGYVGENLLDGAVIGTPFIPPSCEQIKKTVTNFDNTKPVLFIVKNFKEDRQQFEKAQKSLGTLGYQVEILIVQDDVSIDPQTKHPRKRGVAGTAIVHKILGAAANKGLNLAELMNLGKKINENLYTLGVALTGAQLPTQQKASFELTDNEIFYGVGIHGEEGYRKEKFVSSELLGRELVNKLVQVSQITTSDKIVILVNGLGNIPLMETMIFTNDVVKLLSLREIIPEKVLSGNYLTSYNMNGISLTLFKIESVEWLEYLSENSGGFAFK